MSKSDDKARIAFEWEATSLDSQSLAGEEMIAKGRELVETANAAKVLAAESARASRKFAELGHSNCESNGVCAVTEGDEICRAVGCDKILVEQLSGGFTKVTVFVGTQHRSTIARQSFVASMPDPGEWVFVTAWRMTKELRAS